MLRSDTEDSLRASAEGCLEVPTHSRRDTGVLAKANVEADGCTIGDFLNGFSINKEAPT